MYWCRFVAQPPYVCDGRCRGRIGSRYARVVQGARKRYTGVVCRLHQDAPKGYAARAMDAVVDDRPVVTPGQLRMWEWMAGYYMCTRGEVMAAALPSGLKLSSQTRLVVHPEANVDDLRSMAPQAQVLFDAIELRKGLQLSEAAEVLDAAPTAMGQSTRPSATDYLRREWKERYKPKTERTLQCLSRCATKRHWVRPGINWTAGHQASAHFDRVSPVGGRAGRRARCHRIREGSIGARRCRCGGGQTHGSQRAVGTGRTRGGCQRANGCQPACSFAGVECPSIGGLRCIAGEPAGRAHGVAARRHRIGKTEVYIHLIADALERGDTVLFLVPEIALTTQLIQRLSHHFSAFLHVYHSRFTRREQTETWLEVLGKGRPTPKLIVGPRSALFLPMQQLGLIIVDEEHEPSFKQYDPAPRYQARDVAMWMAARDQAFCVLGSATPSVETHWLTTQGRIDRVEMNERYGGVMLPEIWCADLRKAHRQRAMFGHFTRLLKLEMESVLESGRQVILFQNRRGYSPCGSARPARGFRNASAATSR